MANVTNINGLSDQNNHEGNINSGLNTGLSNQNNQGQQYGSDQSGGQGQNQQGGQDHQDQYGDQYYYGGHHDNFYFGNSSGGQDHIYNFNGQSGDHINMQSDYQVSYNDHGDVVLCYGQGDTVTLDGCHSFDYSWASSGGTQDHVWAS